jgi:hypothetical protein
MEVYHIPPLLVQFRTLLLRLSDSPSIQESPLIMEEFRRRRFLPEGRRMG